MLSCSVPSPFLHPNQAYYHYSHPSRTPPTHQLSAMYSGSQFWPLRLILSLSGLIPLITGLSQMIQGPAFTHMLSRNLNLESLQDPMLISQYRFLATVWLAYVPFLVLIMSDPAKYKTLLRIISIHVVIGGCARLYTAYKIGWPIFLYARVIVIGATLLEFLLPLLFELCLRNGLHKLKPLSHYQ